MGGVAQWIERWPENQRVAGLIPSQGTCLGCGPGPQQGVQKRQPHIDVSPSLFLPPFPSLKIKSKIKYLPWLVWLNGLSASLRTKGLLV